MVVPSLPSLALRAVALALALAWWPCTAQEEEEDGGLQEVGFDFAGGQVLPGGASAGTASTLISSQLTYTWGEWYILRIEDNLFLQSETTDARFHL
jgi:hypothetical protein